MKTFVNALVATLVILLPALAHEKAHRGENLVAPQRSPQRYRKERFRRGDKEAKQVTIRHGPIANLDMPAMTMVFQVQDPAVLDRLKPGDKVRFQAEKLEGAYVVTRIEPTP